MLPVVTSPVRPRAIIGLTGEAWRGLRAFRAAYAWLFRELVVFSRGRVLLVVSLNLLGVVLQWVVVGAVLIFVAKLTGEGGAFQVPLLSGVDLPVEASFGVVAVWAIIVLLVVAAASVSAYSAEAIGFETARRYVNHSGRDIIATTLGAQSALAHGGEPPSRQLQLLLSRDQLMVLRALLVIQRSLRAVLMVFVAGIVLALINPVLTAVVAAVATLFIIPYYLVNRRMVGAAAALQQRSAGAAASISRLVEHATSREPNTEIVRVVPELYPTDMAIGERWNVLRDIMLGGQRTAALMSGLTGTSLVAVVVTFGLLIAREGTSWVAALTFVIGLNFASSAFMQLAGLVTAANRFLPHVQDYIAFRHKFRPRVDRMSASMPVEPSAQLPTLRASQPKVSTSDIQLALTPGTRALCVWPGQVDRLNVHSLLSRLVDSSEADARRLREAAFFYGDASSLPPVSVEALLGDFGDAALVELDLVEEVERLPEGRATVLTPVVQQQLSPFLRYALGMLEGLGSQLLVLGWRSFMQLSADERHRLLAVIGPRPVLFVAATMPKRQPTEVTHTIVINEHGIAGMGDADWYIQAAPELQSRGSAQRAVVRAAGTDSEELADG